MSREQYYLIMDILEIWLGQDLYLLGHFWVFFEASNNGGGAQKEGPREKFTVLNPGSWDRRTEPDASPTASRPTRSIT